MTPAGCRIFEPRASPSPPSAQCRRGGALVQVSFSLSSSHRGTETLAGGLRRSPLIPATPSCNRRSRRSAWTSSIFWSAQIAEGSSERDQFLRSLLPVFVGVLDRTLISGHHRPRRAVPQHQGELAHLLNSLIRRGMIRSKLATLAAVFRRGSSSPAILRWSITSGATTNRFPRSHASNEPNLVAPCAPNRWIHL